MIEEKGSLRAGKYSCVLSPSWHSLFSEAYTLFLLMINHVETLIVFFSIKENMVENFIWNVFCVFFSPVCTTC